MNAFIFEKNQDKGITHTTSKSKKFISVGDYECVKFDANSGINYGFFASPLEDEKKDVRIGILRLIIKASSKSKEFAIKSFKYIIELLNDEDDDVRYETILCLEKLIEIFKFIEV